CLLHSAWICIVVVEVPCHDYRSRGCRPDDIDGVEKADDNKMLSS
ncbi:hypothetical protein Tco_0687158, partial [Tanacetum coccineum]